MTAFRHNYDGRYSAMDKFFGTITLGDIFRQFASGASFMFAFLFARYGDQENGLSIMVDKIEKHDTLILKQAYLFSF